MRHLLGDVTSIRSITFLERDDMMISQSKQRGGVHQTPSLSIAMAGKIPRQFWQHRDNEPRKAQVTGEQRIAMSWSVSVVTGHDQLLRNRSFTSSPQSQWLVVGRAACDSRATDTAQGVM